MEAIQKHNERNSQQQVLFFNYAAVEPSLTQEKCSYWHYRFDAHADMRMNALMQVIKADRALQKIYLIGQDYSFGQAVLREAKQQLAGLKSQFIERSANLVKESVAANLETEMTQLKEDIQIARENMFGRRLFEAFASEFAGTHLNENKQIRELQSQVEQATQKLSEAVQAIEDKKALVESKETEIKIIKESTERKERLAEMLKPLNKEKSAIMRDLLESVQTDRLQAAYEKYLPAVLNNSSVATVAPKAAVLTESRTVATGDKTAKTAVESTQAPDVMSNVYEMKRLAGLN
jgi:hypothetical protein